MADPFGELEEAVLATTNGIIVGKSNIPLVNEGEALYHIARFRKPGEAADTVEEFQQEMDPATDERKPGEPPIV